MNGVVNAKDAVKEVVNEAVKEVVKKTTSVKFQITSANIKEACNMLILLSTTSIATLTAFSYCYVVGGLIFNNMFPHRGYYNDT